MRFICNSASTSVRRCLSHPLTPTHTRPPRRCEMTFLYFSIIYFSPPTTIFSHRPRTSSHPKMTSCAKCDPGAHTRIYAENYNNIGRPSVRPSVRVFRIPNTIAIYRNRQFAIRTTFVCILVEGQCLLCTWHHKWDRIILVILFYCLLLLCQFRKHP